MINAEDEGMLRDLVAVARDRLVWEAQHPEQYADLRDHFAMAALPVVARNYTLNDWRAAGAEAHRMRAFELREVATLSYQLADEMLAARVRRAESER